MTDRAENQRRLAHIAAILADSGQVVLVPAISPLQEHRELARRVTTEAGLDFFEVFCDTPLEDCERRDPKGLYAKARAGEITHFTGIDSPYQRPKNPDLRLTPDRSTDELAELVMRCWKAGDERCANGRAPMTDRSDDDVAARDWPHRRATASMCV
jgi:bifunctional enzyme CysN/CysC